MCNLVQTRPRAVQPVTWFPSQLMTLFWHLAGVLNDFPILRASFLLQALWARQTGFLPGQVAFAGQELSWPSWSPE